MTLQEQYKLVQGTEYDVIFKLRNENWCILMSFVLFKLYYRVKIAYR